MEKKYFLWLQEIANINDKFNVQIYFNIKNVFNDFNELFDFIDEDTEVRLREIEIDESIIKNLKDNNIKEKINIIYSYINGLNFNLITLNDYYFNCNFKLFKFEIPFCIITTEKLNLNCKNIYLYYSDYYTKFATNIIYYFSKVISEENANAISLLKNENIFNIEILDYNNLSKIEGNKIILSNSKYLNWFIFCFIDSLIIIEARYEKEIVNLVEKYIELGKDIYVVPSNIFRKNSYFSNYLIKQGADIILNKHDVKFMLKKNIR